MNISGNTILITGGGSGIGLALAEALRKLDNKVIVAGRSRAKLEDAKAKGLEILAVDMTSEKSIREMADEAIGLYPGLNVVIHNAGIMKNEKLSRGKTSAIASETVATNLLGPIHLTNALLPYFLKQKSATVMTVTSGLAYVPLALTPTYSATKAAVHSYTESLRYQLQGTSVEVKELVPPYVQTTLMGDRQATDPHAMPLEDFINEVISILREHPRIDEIRVQRVLPQRTAAFGGEAKYQETFASQNDRLLAARRAEWDAL